MRGILGFEVIEEDVLSHTRKPQHRQLCQQKLPKLVMYNPAHELGLRAVLIVIQKPIVGSDTHIGKNRSVAAKVLEVHKIHAVIIQESSGTYIEIKFAAYTKIEKVLHARLHKIKLGSHGIVEYTGNGFGISEIEQRGGFV
jgi:hypothetical protein